MKMNLIIARGSGATRLPQTGLYRFLFLSVLVLTPLASGTPVGPATRMSPREIAPTTVNIRLSADGQRAYSTFLKDRQGKPTFRLLIEPNTSVDGSIANWQMELLDLGSKGATKRNLLAPAGIWHGIQGFDFDMMTINWPIEQGYGKIRLFHVLSSFSLLVLVDGFQTDPATDSMRGLVLTLYVIPDQK